MTWNRDEEKGSSGKVKDDWKAHSGRSDAQDCRWESLVR